MCCCPSPYAPCKRSERDQRCDQAMHKHLAGSITKENAVEKLQLVRSELWRADPRCQQFFANPEPISKCGYETYEERSVDRADLFCETVTWQWEQLGDGNEAELERNDCPIPAVPRGR